MEDPIEEVVVDEGLTTDIYNLSGALSSLNEIETDLLSAFRKKKLSKMKRLIFDLLAFYVDCLPEPSGDPAPEGE